MDVVKDVSDTLTPGKAGVVADIDEYWVTPVESRLGALGALGATTFRRFRGEALDEQVAREALATKVELEQLRTELASVVPGNRHGRAPSPCQPEPVR